MSGFSRLSTIKEEFKDFKDIVLTFIGDGNNVANSLILCGALLGVEVRIACPKGFEPNSLVIKKALEINNTKGLLKICNDVHLAAKGRMFCTQMFGHQWEKKRTKMKKISNF